MEFFYFFEIVRLKKEHRLSQYGKALIKQDEPKHLLDPPRNMYHSKIDTFYPLKPSQNKNGRKKFLDAPKLVSFLQLVAEKRTQFWVQLDKCSALLIL